MVDSRRRLAIDIPDGSMRDELTQSLFRVAAMYVGGEIGRDEYTERHAAVLEAFHGRFSTEGDSARVATGADHVCP